MRFFRHLACVYLYLQRNKKFHKLRQLKLIYLKKIKILHRILFKLKQANSIFNGVSKIQKRLRIIFAAKLKCKQQYILQRLKIQNNIITYQNKALKAGNSFFFVSLFNAVKVNTNTLDFFLQYKDVIKNQAFGTSAITYFNKYHLIQILFQVISHVKHFVYFYYFKLYSYFYYFKFFNKILKNFRNNLVLLRKLFLLYKTSLNLNNKNNTLFKNYYASVNKKITAIKNKNAFKLKYYLKEKLASQKIGKLYFNIRFNLKNLLIYRKAIFTKYTLKYKMRILASKYKKYSKYRFIYYLLYPVNTFKRILYKYKTLRNMRIKYKYFKYVFKKNLKFFFKKYVIANKLNLVKPFIINNNIYIFYKNILLNLLIIIYLRQAKKYLFIFKNFYYHFLCRKSLMQMRNPLLDFKNINPYKSICLFYMRQFFTQINHIYALNSNIFLTNFVKKIKMLVFYMGHNTFQNTKALAYLRDIHIEFFNYFNFFTINLLENSKYRLYFSKYLYLLINTSSKKLKISSNTKKNYNFSYIKKKYIISSIFSLPKKINMLQKFYYICKIRAFTNILAKHKNLLSSKLNCTVLQYAQLRSNIKKNNKFFYKNFRFFYTKNLLFVPGPINACKRIQNSFIYLNKYFIKYNFVTYYKTFRNYYKKLLTLQTYYNIADLKFIMYI